MPPRSPTLAVILAVLLSMGGVAAEHAVDPTRITAALSSRDKVRRREATYQLSQPGVNATPFLPALIKALDDADRQVFSNVLTAIGNLGPAGKDALPALIAKLDGEKAKGKLQRDRRQSLLRVSFTIAQMGPEVIPTLLPLLQSKDLETRRGATKALGGMGKAGQAALPALIANLSHADPDLRSETIEAIAVMTPDPMKVLVPELANQDALRREGILLVLAKMGTEAGAAASSVLDLLAQEKSTPVRVAALAALPRLKADPDRSIRPLIEAIFSEDPTLHRAGTNALLSASAFAARGRPILLEELQTPNPPERAAAAHVLGKMGPSAEAAIPLLIQAAEQQPNEPTFSHALAEIGGKALPSLLPLIEKNTDHPDQLSWIFRTLHDMGTPAYPALTDAIKSPKPLLRAQSAQAFRGLPIEGKPIVPILLALLDDPDPSVRAAAIRTLARVKNLRDSLPAKLKAARSDASPEVSLAATGALVAIGAAADLSVADIAAQLNDPDSETQQAAAQTLAERLPLPPEAIDALIQKLDEPAVQYAVMDALGKIGPAASIAVPRIFASAQQGDDELQLAALKALGKIGCDYTPLLTMLRKAAGSHQRELRALAIQLLPKADPNATSSLPLLVNALGDWFAPARRAATQGLKGYAAKAQPAIRLLLPLLDRDADRPMAIDILRSIGIQEIPTLLQLLQHPDATVQTFTCEALSKLGPAAQEAIPVLEQYLTTCPDSLKPPAQRALEKIRTKAP